MNLTQKILDARQLIKEMPTAKEGRNDFSKYDYFTPSQVSEAVNTVCQKLKILPVFSLCKDEHGIYGQLDIIDCEENQDSNTLTTYMRTEMPEMKASNKTQQMGSCDTYTKRYMLMSAFCITDNSLDPDSQDNRPKAPQSVPKPQTEDKGMDIPLAVRNSNTVLELEVLWSTLNKEQQTKNANLITIRKKELS